MMSKSEVDKWLVDNYKEMNTALHGMTAKKNLVYHADDLMSNTYMYVVKKTFKDELELKKAFLNRAKKQLEWSDSEFYREIFAKIKPGVDYKEVEISETDDLEYKVEQHNTFEIKKGSIELYRISLKTVEEKIMYHLYFERGLDTMDKLYDHLNAKVNIISEASCTRLLRDLREGIQEIYTKNGGVLPTKKKWQKKKSK